MVATSHLDNRKARMGTANRGEAARTASCGYLFATDSSALERSKEFQIKGESQ
jgi:hypothetical protein